MKTKLSLQGRVALVAGVTRGAGRGIARMLGAAGAIVYCTGRSARGVNATPGRTETIDETAEYVSAEGGQGIAVQVDHSVALQVEALAERIKNEQGRLDILVNDIWGGDALTEWKPFWELDVAKGKIMLERAILTHAVTSRYLAPLMIANKFGLIVEVTDGDGTGYRGTLFYDICKHAAIRMAYGMSLELERAGVTALSITPGYLRSETMLDMFGVTEENWREAISQDRFFAESESPCLIGRAVAALAADPHVSRYGGKALTAAQMAKEYGFADIDGRVPNFYVLFDAVVDEILQRDGSLNDHDRHLLTARYWQLHADGRCAARVSKIRERLHS